MPANYNANIFEQDVIAVRRVLDRLKTKYNIARGNVSYGEVRKESAFVSTHVTQNIDRIPHITLTRGVQNIAQHIRQNTCSQSFLICEIISAITLEFHF